jgi:NitT/TauT family transport system substrate-binding protein
MRVNLIFILVLAVLGSACRNHARSTGDRSSIIIASLKGPSSMCLIRFIDSISNDADTDIKIEILDEPIQVRKMMLEGSAGFALLPTTMASILYNKGLDFKLIAIPVWGTMYLFGEDTTIKRWEDLRNRRVNVMAKEMTPDVLFRYLLEKNGLDPEEDIILDYSFPTHIDLANAVAAGQAKLGVLSEPQVSLVMKRNKNVHPIFDLNSEWNKIEGIPIAQTAFMVKESILQNEPVLVEKIVSACERSVQWVNNYPDSAAALIVKYKILPDYEVAYNAIPRSNMDFKRAPGLRTQITEFLDIFYKMNPDIIGGKLPDENFIY